MSIIPTVGRKSLSMRAADRRHLHRAVGRLDHDGLSVPGDALDRRQEQRRCQRLPGRAEVLLQRRRALRQVRRDQARRRHRSDQRLLSDRFRQAGERRSASDRAVERRPEGAGQRLEQVRQEPADDLQAGELPADPRHIPLPESSVRRVSRIPVKAVQRRYRRIEQALPRGKQRLRNGLCPVRANRSAGMAAGQIGEDAGMAEVRGVTACGLHAGGRLRAALHQVPQGRQVRLGYRQVERRVWDELQVVHGCTPVAVASCESKGTPGLGGVRAQHPALPVHEGLGRGRACLPVVPVEALPRQALGRSTASTGRVTRPSIRLHCRRDSRGKARRSRTGWSSSRRPRRSPRSMP